MYLCSNPLAVSTANILSNRYSDLAASTQRLSTGLRINSAADDASGLAIRELMRADIAATNQGIRNVNDAISLLQTMDGALSIIDEKLIRLKELAEQAATGSYDSVQRLMIDSEFQMMASEIERIAQAADWNGIKLLDGEFEISSETSSSSSIATSSSSSSGNTWSITANPSEGVAVSLDESTINNLSSAGAFGESDTITLKNNHIFSTSINGSEINVSISGDSEFIQDIKNNSLSLSLIQLPNGKYSYTVTEQNISGYTLTQLGLSDGTSEVTFYDQVRGLSAGSFTIKFSPGIIYSGSSVDFNLTIPENYPVNHEFSYTMSSSEYGNSTLDSTDIRINGNSLEIDIPLLNNQSYTQVVNFDSTPDIYSLNSMSINLTKQNSSSKNLDSATGSETIPDDIVKIHFGPTNSASEDYYYIDKSDATLSGLGLDNLTITTQDSAQAALKTIDEAIVKKDTIRAYYGAMQNRLENTIAQLRLQAENLQIAESRISDIDIAQEMTGFIKKQILSQSAIAMLAQANSMPQMAMRLIT